MKTPNKWKKKQLDLTMKAKILENTISIGLALILCKKKQPYNLTQLKNLAHEVRIVQVLRRRQQFFPSTNVIHSNKDTLLTSMEWMNQDKDWLLQGFIQIDKQFTDWLIC